MGEFISANWSNIIAATFASYVFGSIWYMVLGKQWAAAAGLDMENQKPKPITMIMTFVCQLIMAFTLAGVIFHVTELSVKTGLMSAGIIWFGFVLMTMKVNYGFQDRPTALTVIDGLHWLGVLLIQGAVLGALA